MPVQQQSIDHVRTDNKVIDIQWCHSANDIADELWQRCFPPPLEGKWWYSTLENSNLNDQFTFFYGLVKIDSIPVGIVPAFLMDVPMEIMAPDIVVPLVPFLKKVVPAICYQRIFFVGSPCADEGTIGLIAGIELPSIVQPLYNNLIEKTCLLKASMLVWKDFPDSSQLAMDLLSKKNRIGKGLAYPGTVALIPQANIDAYYQSLKSSHRHNLLKKLNRSRASLPVATTVTQNPDQQTLDEIFTLFWQTYEKGKTKFERLNKQFFSLIAQQKTSWWILLHNPADKKLVAFMLCFLIGDKVINKFVGLDYNMAKEHFLYFRLWHAAVEWTTSIGIKEIQSGQTGYRFKLDVGHKLVPLFNYFWHKNAIIHWIYAQFSNNTPWSELDEDLRIYLKAHPEADIKLC
jgi:hypothetical protein